MSTLQLHCELSSEQALDAGACEAELPVVCIVVEAMKGESDGAFEGLEASG
eukprot:TRINITY_DN509_c0_g1_i2.p4 TRINITY_DN509_c0_g1~~TRINITY_DN509_c0_g1_i2.p4  ORF type:complete len:51 (+),score=10.97 TRINITY_DN509_c0_g1_i2:352-504(+)